MALEDYPGTPNPALLLEWLGNALREGLYDQLLRRAYHLTGDEIEAQDVVNDTLVKATESILRGNYRQLDDERAFRAWLFTILQHVVYDRARYRGRRPPIRSLQKTAAESADESDQVIDVEDPTARVEADAANLAHGTTVVERILVLTQKLKGRRKILVLLLLHVKAAGFEAAPPIRQAISEALRDYFESPPIDRDEGVYEQLAAILGTTVGTIKAELYAVRRVLRAKYLAAYQENIDDVLAAFE